MKVSVLKLSETRVAIEKDGNVQILDLSPGDWCIEHTQAWEIVQYQDGEVTVQFSTDHEELCREVFRQMLLLRAGSSQTLYPSEGNRVVSYRDVQLTI